MLLRAAVPGDEMAVARVHVRSWQEGYRGILPETYLDALRPEDRAARYNFEHADPLAPFTTVAVEDESIVGFATTGPAREADDSGCGELYALYVDPESWKRGVGRTLISSARDHLSRRGFQRALLWVIAANPRARRFYESDSWSTDGVSRHEIVWGITVESVCYRRLLQVEP